MMVVRVEMWPQGDAARVYPLSLAALSCIGQANANAPEHGVVLGERRYHVRLFKDVAFGGPTDGPFTERHIWRSGIVRGHLPGKRGVWDLLGGALHHLLGPRLDGYKAETAQGNDTPQEEDWPPVGSYWKMPTCIARIVGHLRLTAQLSCGSAPDEAVLGTCILATYEDGAEGPSARGRLLYLEPRAFTDGSCVPWTKSAPAGARTWVPTAAALQPMLKRLMDSWWERVFFARGA